MKEGRLLEAVLEKSKTRDGARPAPAFVSNFEHFNGEGVAGFGAADGDGPGQSVNFITIDLQEVLNRGAGADLTTARVDAFHSYGIAGVDSQARSKRVVPSRVGGFGEESVFGHG